MKHFFSRKPVLMLLAALVLLISESAAAALITVNTNASWRSYDSEELDWNLVGFDDSHWRSAYEDYTTHPPASYTHLVDAKTIWDWPNSGVPSGADGPLKAYFRFELDLASAVEDASFEYAVDDAMILYINGIQVYAHAGAGNTNVPGLRSIDTSLFSIGVNVLAFEAWDGHSGAVFQRGGEALTASFLIETTDIPEPRGLLLFGSGAVALYTIRFRLAG